MRLVIRPTPAHRVLTALLAFSLVWPWPSAAPSQGDQPFKPEELDQIVAPIALYPDPLLAQVFNPDATWKKV
jgi:hypothetical protein